PYTTLFRTANNQGYKTFLFSGELIGGNVKYWLLQTLANEEQFAEYTAKDGHKYKKVTMQGKEKIIQDMKDRFFLYDNDDYRIEAIIEKMTILAKRYGVRVFVIDNLMTVESSLKDKYEAETDIVKKLKNFAKKYNALVHLVAHPRKSMNDEIEKDDVAGSANITNLADYVTTISRAKDEEVEYDAILKILKNSHTGVNVSNKLMFSIARKRNYSADTEKELNNRYIDNYEEIFKILKNRHIGVKVGKKVMFSIERIRFFSAETEKEPHKRYLDNFEQLGIDEWDNI